MSAMERMGWLLILVMRSLGLSAARSAGESGVMEVILAVCLGLRLMPMTEGMG